MTHLKIVGGFLLASCMLGIALTQSNFMTNMVMVLAIFSLCLVYTAWVYMRDLE